ncbi:hypothetical protein ABFS83_04G140400 [Erythranthe nasuta]
MSDLSFLFVPSASGYTSTVCSFEFSLCFLLFVAAFAFWLTPGGLAWVLSRAQARPANAIPGPSGLPLLGLLLTFTHSLTHRILSDLSKKFGAKPLMALSVGFTRFVVSSSPETAREILNSSAFADRPVKESAYELLFHRAMGFAPYGDYWRNLRRISAAHLFSPRRVALFGNFRREIGLKMAEEIASKMAESSRGLIQVKNVLHFGSLNNVMMSVFGKCYDFSDENSDGVVLEELVREGYELLGIFNYSDHFPFMWWMDLQGVRRRSKILVAKVNNFVGKIIDEHRLKRGLPICDKEDDDCDFVDVLLDLEKKEKGLSDSDMIAVLWEMIFRGTDTVAILLEWILARMILHPEIQSKAQQEIDGVIRKTDATISDSDLQNLPYIQAIVKETLRMHPPGPLLSWARLAVHDVQVGPHFIPAGTTAMVNMWAIAHDEKVWPKPEIFRPERFLEEEVSIMGGDLRLAPFGSGRRVCPGKNMGIATVQLWLAQLLHKFTWTSASNDNYGVDLSECLKLSLEMKQPLICKAIPRFS